MIQDGRGLEELNAKKASEALSSAQTAIAQDAKRWEAYALAGTALRVQGQQNQAVSMYTKAISRAPSEKQASLEKMVEQTLTDQTSRANPPTSSSAGGMEGSSGV